ncbi:hypothetical protein MKW92_021052 [Papaver armeniacum]|nr:hypothetical protein MKW92_021052 [Papaver armeniacum]
MLDSPSLQFCNNIFSYHSHPLHHHSLKLLNPKPSGFRSTNQIPSYSSSSSSSSSTPIDQILPEEQEDNLDLSSNLDYSDEDDGGGNLVKNNLPSSPVIEVKELEELPEQWRGTRIAWLCKELPSHKPPSALKTSKCTEKMDYSGRCFIRCVKRDNETAFSGNYHPIEPQNFFCFVYKWMIRQRWFQFDFALANRTADYTEKERKFSRCREIFDDIINKGRLPSESTFHILAYLRSSEEGCLEEAYGIYNRMIQFGGVGYQPRLSLHNSLFRALIGKRGGSSKQFLQQAEFIFHNIKTSELEIQKDICAGLIWLHSYQDEINRERIMELREEMQRLGFEVVTDVLVSFLRAYSKEGDVEGTERIWLKLLGSDTTLPYQAFVYRMEVYSEVGEHMKSLDIFRAMQDHLGFTTFKPTRLNLTKEQREILIGLLLGGLQIESDEERKVHAIQFEFNQDSSVHSALKRHIHDEYHEWVKNPSKVDEEGEEILFKFSTIAHTYFGFYNILWGYILLKPKGGNREDVERIVKSLKAMSLDCRIIKPDVQSLELDEDQDIKFDSESDSEEYISDQADAKTN